MAAAVFLSAALVSVTWDAPRASADPTPNEVRSQVNELNTKMRNANESLNRARDQLEESQQKRSEVEGKLGELQTKHDEASGKVGELGAAAYQNGGNMSASTLFTSGSPKTMLDQLSYIDIINVENSKALHELEAAKKKLNDAKKTIDEEVKKGKEATEAAEKLRSTLQADYDKWKKLFDKYFPPDNSPTRGGTYNGPASGAVRAVMEFAFGAVGIPYVFGAAGPNAYDCSGLTQAAWKRAGVSLPHSARQQWNKLSGRRVSLDSLVEGDLVFFYSGVSHVGLYIGNGKMIHAPQPGQRVKESPIRISGMPIKGAARPG